jgi:hypothetical protein
MSASTSPQPPSHRIAVLMAPEGRFLQCRDCQLSFAFPAGAQYAATARRFRSHLCDFPVRIDRRIENSVPHRTVPSSERRFVIVRYEGKVPAMASCSKCQRKFFTPPTFAREAIGAAQYLGQKFDLHDCPEEIEERDKRGRLF